MAMAKKSGRHPEKALSATKVRSITKSGRYADGNGLYLVVAPSGAKRWILRTMVHGRRRDIGLGGLKLVSLSDARQKAAEYRRIAREGGDPIAEKRRAERVIPSFEEAARTVHKEHSAAWRNKKHSAQWINTLSEYAFPAIGKQRIDQIDTPAILKVLSPIWLTKPETARRVKQRIGTVMDWAKASGFRDGENPVVGVATGLAKQPEKQNHFTALPYADIPDFIAQLRISEAAEPTKLAFEFLVLTAARTSEVLHASWSEIDLENGVWTVPWERMKAKREHRVPLSARCAEILARAKKVGGGSDFVFPGRSLDKPISNMAFLMTLRRLKIEATAHGFRSSFRDWSAERTNFPREVCELALAHSNKDKIEAAYQRSDLFEKRRELMDTWAAYVTNTSAEVVALRAG